jgi:phosphoglycolate phosphatase
MEGRLMLPKPKAVLFDWDDTIVHNWETAVQSLNTALVHMGMAPWDENEIRRRSGPSARDLFTQLFGDKWQEADKVYFDTFRRLSLENIKIFDHAEDLLRLLSMNGVAMAVVSNKRPAMLRHEVVHVGFRPYFTCVIGAGDAPADKPDPAPLLVALKECNIQPGADVWYVGDSHTDMIAAARAGCSGVLIETKPPPEDLLAAHPPKARFTGHKNIMEFIEGKFI